MTGTNRFVEQLNSSIVRAVLLCAAAVLGAGAHNARAQTTVAGLTPGSFGVNPSGAATYTIPIQVPPGIAGLEPKLALAYNSQGGNGLLGMGWSLSGLSSFQRCPRTLAQDGARGGINYDANDRYCLDGQRLMSIGTASDCAAGTEYRTEVESFAKVISCGTAGNGPAFFKVWTKAGQIMEFGNTPDSQIEAQGKPTIRVWALNRISDRKSNYLTVIYTEDSVNGDFYPSRIDYTGNTATGAAPNASVQFVPDAAIRSDVVPAYVAGSVIKTLRRFAYVRTYVASNLVKEYRLAYEYGTGTGRSRLTQITECRSDGACLPSTNFQWVDVSPGFVRDDSWVIPGGTSNFTVDGADAGLRIVDLNGDGLPDLLHSVFSNNGWYGGGNIQRAYINNGHGFDRDDSWVIPGGTSNFTVDGADAGLRVVDLNGDGLPDLLHSVFSGTWYGGGSIQHAYINTGHGFVRDDRWAIPGDASNFSVYGADAGLREVDLNGDGLPDLLHSVFSNNGWYGGGSIQRAYRTNSPFIKPDTLLSTANSLGATTSITSRPLTDNSVYTKDNPLSSYPILSLQNPMYVVSSSSSSNGIGGTQQANYTYAGAKADQLGRGLLGFRNFTATDPQTQISTSTTFRQDYPYIGMASRVDRTGPGGAPLLSRVDNTTFAATAFGGTRYFPYVSQSVTSGNDLNGVALPTVTTATVYDAYGNPTSIVASTGDGYSKTTTNTYAAPDTANWFLGRLIRSTVTSVIP